MKINTEIIKLALIKTLVEALAEVDLDVVSGFESELELSDGTKFTITVNGERL